MLGVAFGIVLCSVVFSPSDTGVSVAGFALPELCAFRRVFTLDCLGCGLTRSFVYMGHGQWSAALDAHWLGPLGWLFVTCQVPWRGFVILRAHSLRAR